MYTNTIMYITMNTCAIYRLQKSNLKFFIDILGLHRTGSKEEQVDRILDFLIAPTDSGKPAATKSKSILVFIR